MHAGRLEPLEVLWGREIGVQQPDADLVLLAHPPLAPLAAVEVERGFGAPEVDRIRRGGAVEPVGATASARLADEQLSGDGVRAVGHRLPVDTARRSLAAAAPMSSKSWLTVVSVGVESAPASIPSKPTMARSSGSFTPRSASTPMQPIAFRSVAKTSAEIGSSGLEQAARDRGAAELAVVRRIEEPLVAQLEPMGGHRRSVALVTLLHVALHEVRCEPDSGVAVADQVVDRGRDAAGVVRYCRGDVEALDDVASEHDGDTASSSCSKYPRRVPVAIEIRPSRWSQAIGLRKSGAAATSSLLMPASSVWMKTIRPSIDCSSRLMPARTRP